jgi:hypothetical protein
VSVVAEAYAEYVDCRTGTGLLGAVSAAINAADESAAVGAP